MGSRVVRKLSQVFWWLLLGLAALEPMGAAYMRVGGDDVREGDLDEPADRSYERTVIRRSFHPMSARR